MDRYVKTKIRLERAQRKIDKRIYPSCPKTKKVVKLNERREQLNKDIDATYSIMYSRGFRPGKDNQNPAFYNDFDFILRCEKEIDRISKSVDKLCKLLGKTEEEINKEMYYLNVGKGSTSYH